MNVPALLAANILIVGAGILTYDVMQPDAPMAGVTADGETIDLTRIEKRLDDLERRLDGFGGAASDRKVTSRLLNMESRLAAMESAATPATTASPAATESENAAGALVAAAEDGELAAADLATVKKAVEQLESDRERQRSGRGVDRIIDRLGLQLTDDQKKRLGDEFTAFRGKMRDNFRNGRTEGRTREDMIANMETLRDDFGKSLTEFLPQTDADSIIEELGNSMGGGGRRGPPGGFGGGGGIR